jgi:undecaprenyl-diphosphatase
MMNYLYAFIFGIIQGFTEFLPVSSSGHLVLLHEFVELPFSSDLAFDVTLHLATLAAVLFYFRSDIISIISAWLGSLRGRSSQEGKLGWLLILGSVPAALVGVLFEDRIEESLRSVWIVISMLVAVAVLFIIVEKRCRPAGGLETLDWKRSLWVGLAQAMALVPGTSRSGITIIAGMTVGLKREAAIRFSFLLSAPIIAGAGLIKIPQLFGAEYSFDQIFILLIGASSAMISGLLAIKFLLRFARSNTLVPFAIYRIILALVLVSYFWTL